MGGDLPTADVLPDAIVSLDQWLCWRTQDRDGKETKIPVNPHTGRFGSATSPDSWAGFAEAREYAVKGNVDGLGFVFTDDDPIVGVDLDDCRVPETGTLTGPAPDIVDTLDSYTEVSPSGTGVHVLVEGALPGERNRSGSVEMYETARFFTVTGDHVGGTPRSIERRHDELTEVHTEHVALESDSPDGSVAATTDISSESTSDHEGARSDTGPTTSDEVTRSGSSATSEADSTDETSGLADDELVERAKSASNGEKFARLWRGDTSGYDSHSEADMALCALLAFWSGGDERQIDRLFRDSGLMREKWDERHYADGSTYGEKTIGRVLDGTDEFYDPNPEPAGGNDDDQLPPDSEVASDVRRIDADAAATVRRLRQERDELEDRERRHLDLIDELRTQVERLEAENDRLRLELEELRDPVDDEEGTNEGDAVSPSTFTRLRRWLTGPGTDG